MAHFRVGLLPNAGTETYNRELQEHLQMNKQRRIDFKVGDEISCAMPSGMLYGTVKRVLGAGESAAIEIEFEDGRKEIRKVKDRAVALLRRASGTSEEEERQVGRGKLRDPDIDFVRRSDVRRRW
jgi:hypothetical protein